MRNFNNVIMGTNDPAGRGGIKIRIGNKVDYQNKDDAKKAILDFGYVEIPGLLMYENKKVSPRFVWIAAEVIRR